MFAITWRNILNRAIGRGSPAPVEAVQPPVERGKVLSAAGRHGDAKAAFQHAIALAPDDADAHYWLGLACRDLQNLDDAVASYGRALAIRPDFAEAHNNLGAALQMQGKLGEALISYRLAVSLQPQFSQPYLNLGRLLEVQGDSTGAAATYRLAIAMGIEPDAFQHLLAAVEGASASRAPAAYSRLIFDGFAENFDRRLIDELDYRIPQLLAARVAARYALPVMRVLDLGCGTGLCGTHLAIPDAKLTGVDLSPAMLEKARARGIYHELIECDLVTYLQTAPSAEFDAVLAADVFTYIGDLLDVFRETTRTLKTGGLFAFSVEHAHTPGDYLLMPTGRYAQSVSYIRRLAAASGFNVLEATDTTIRGTSHDAAQGQVFVLRKS